MSPVPEKKQSKAGISILKILDDASLRMVEPTTDNFEGLSWRLIDVTMIWGILYLR